MRITSNVAHMLVFLIFALTLSSIVSCSGIVATPIPATTTPTNTLTILPSKTSTATVTPLPTATDTPTDLVLLDKRTKALFGDPASIVIDFFLEIQDCIRVDDKEKLASLIYYPITIHSIEGKDVEIKNEREFVANYEKIATPKWKGVILAQEPAKLFTNWQGIMVNRGELWFGPLCLDTDCKQTKYYIYAITNDTPW